MSREEPQLQLVKKMPSETNAPKQPVTKAPGTILLKVPKGAKPGSKLTVRYGGQSHQFKVPAGARVGDTFKVQVPP